MTDSPSSRVFILSPAFIGGARARILLNPHAPFPLARQFHAEGLAIAAVFAFASGLYFRGKITYARWFAGKNSGHKIRIVTSNAGLLAPDVIVRPSEVAAFGETEIDPADPSYRKPLRRHALALDREMGHDSSVILLGSIATPKYREVLLEVFGPRLLFPTDFVGRGDMSRGALLLRATRDDRELPYAVVQSALLTGRRAPPVAELGRKK